MPAKRNVFLAWRKAAGHQFERTGQFVYRKEFETCCLVGETLAHATVKYLKDPTDDNRAMLDACAKVMLDYSTEVCDR